MPATQLLYAFLLVLASSPTTPARAVLPDVAFSVVIPTTPKLEADVPLTPWPLFEMPYTPKPEEDVPPTPGPPVVFVPMTQAATVLLVVGPAFAAPAARRSAAVPNAAGDKRASTVLTVGAD